MRKPKGSDLKSVIEKGVVVSVRSSGQPGSLGEIRDKM